jgi:hypothetical protein
MEVLFAFLLEIEIVDGVSLSSLFLCSYEMTQHIDVHDSKTSLKREIFQMMTAHFSKLHIDIIRRVVSRRLSRRRRLLKNS